MKITFRPGILFVHRLTLDLESLLSIFHYCIRGLLSSSSSLEGSNGWIAVSSNGSMSAAAVVDKVALNLFKNR